MCNTLSLHVELADIESVVVKTCHIKIMFQLHLTDTVQTINVFNNNNALTILTVSDN